MTALGHDWQQTFQAYDDTFFRCRRCGLEVNRRRGTPGPTDHGACTCPRVRVEFYDDRGDPPPPNNYRVELVLGKHRFSKCYGEFMSKAEAESLATELRELLLKGEPNQ